MENLSFLEKASSTDLQVLVDYLTKAKDGSFRWTEELSCTPNYKAYYPNRLQLMWTDIAGELQNYGGNTFMNMVRGHGVPYREILIDVCKKMKVNFNKKSSVEVMERCLLEKILIDSLENMTMDELKKLMEDMNIPTQSFGRQSMIAAIQIAIKRGGFASYQIAVIVANAICRFLLGRGLSFAANAALTRYLSIFAGPIGWGINIVWATVDIAGPAYRVTIPATVQIAYMRAKMIDEESISQTLSLQNIV